MKTPSIFDWLLNHCPAWFSNFFSHLSLDVRAVTGWWIHPMCWPISFVGLIGLCGLAWFWIKVRKS